MTISRLIVGIQGVIALVRAQFEFPPMFSSGFILEYEEGVDIDDHLSSIQHLAATRLKLDYQLFKGASIRFHNHHTAQHEAELLAGTAPVKQLWPIYFYGPEKYTLHWNYGEDVTRKGQDVLETRQAPADTFSTHVMTQVNQLRDEGILGEGIKVAVVDTGIDYKHPALGGCFGPGCLVSFGHDLVGDAFNGSSTPVPGPDPLDCAGHGTHVAGIIAAQTNNPLGIIGAATGVQLGSYRVFGCEGATSNEILIAAFNMAYEDGADIITASIGGPSGWSEEPSSVVVSRIVENGVPCTISAGNDGANGVFYADSAANGKRVTAVASVDNIVTPELLTEASYTVQDGPGVSFGYAPGEPSAWGNVTLPLWAVSLNTTDPANACSALPDDTPDLSGKIVLVRRGGCLFVQKIGNVAAKGAEYVLFYNDELSGTSDVYTDEVSAIKAVGMVTADQGVTWISSFSAGHNVTVAMTDPDTAPMALVTIPNDLTGGYASTLTAWGPTYEVEFKPQFAAPGGRILSTYPTHMGSYAVFSGTSMATPLVAAIYALLMKTRGTKHPRTLENLLSSTSKPNLFNDGNRTYPILAPAVQQGAGLVQAYDAAYAKSLLSVSSLSFNDTDHIKPVQSFIISNTGNESVVYWLGHEGAATAYALPGDGSIYPASFPNDLLDDYATIEFRDGDSFTIPAGGSEMVRVTATPPHGLDASRLPVYSGYISINGSDGSGLSLPYIGIAGSLYSATVLDTAGTYIASSLDGAQANVSANHTFMLPPPGHSNDTRYMGNSTDYPQLVVSLALGSALVRVDLVPVVVPLDANITETLGLKTIGSVYMTPLAYKPRGDYFSNWDGRLASGKYAPDGTYKMVIRALKIFGDRDKADQYEMAETVEFSIQYINSDPPSAKLRRW